MNGADRVAVTTGMKLVSLLLIVGGVTGAAFGWWAELQIFHQGNIAVTVLYGLFVLLFAWSAWTGFELWKGKRQAVKMAQLILAAQIPNFTIPGFSFDGFYTGLRVYFMISERPPNLRWGFNLQSALHFAVSPEIDYWLFGINLLALAAFVHLIRVGRPAAPETDRFGLI